MTSDSRPQAASAQDAQQPADMPFEGPAEFARALYRSLLHAERANARRVCWCDDDFAAWPLNEPDWVAILTRWGRVSGRELVVVASDYRAIERLHPRFVAWRRDWGHVVQCLVPEETRTIPLPTLWVDTADQALRVFDREHWRGRAGFDRVDRQRVREEFDAIAQRASPGFATVTLGL